MTFDPSKYKSQIKTILQTHSEEDLTPKLVRKYLEEKLKLEEGALLKHKREITELVKSIADSLNSSDGETEPIKRKREKKPKDDNKPKKAANSFTYFSAEYRIELKKENPSITFPETSTACSKKWKEMDESEKEKYTKKAEADKERYNAEMDTYNQEHPDEVAPKKAKRTAKSNGPTKPKSAYTYYCNDKKQEMKEKNKGSSPSEILSLLAQAWNDCDEDEKAKYILESEKDKERYDSEMKEEKENNPPSKPRTAYFIFNADVRESVRAENPSLNLPEISKVLGERWKALSEEERAGYTKRAEEEKEEYATKLSEWEEDHPEQVKARKEDADALAVYIKLQKDLGKNATACRKEWNSFSDSQKEKYKQKARDHDDSKKEKKKKETKKVSHTITEYSEPSPPPPKKEKMIIDIAKAEGSDGEYELDD